MRIKQLLNASQLTGAIEETGQSDLQSGRIQAKWEMASVDDQRAVPSDYIAM